MEILLLLAAGAINCFCFLIGAKVGQMVSNGEKIELPSLNPTKVIREQRDRRAAEKEQEIIDAIMHNTECYDGTSRGQKDIPRR